MKKKELLWIAVALVGLYLLWKNLPGLQSVLTIRSASQPANLQTTDPTLTETIPLNEFA